MGVVECPDCHQKIPRYAFAEHKDGLCSAQASVCPLCDTKILSAFMEEHLRQCAVSNQLDLGEFTGAIVVTTKMNSVRIQAPQVGGSVADLGGLLVGDQVLSIDGEETMNKPAFERIASNWHVGERHAFMVRRRGMEEPFELMVTI